MRHTDTRTVRRGPRGSLAPRLAGLGLLLPLGACSVDKLLQVQDPDVVPPTAVTDPTALPGVYAGAISDFAEAYGGGGNTGGGGGNEGQILLSGLLGDEFRASDTFNTRIEIDMRDITLTSTGGTSSNGQLSDTERNLHRARRAAENATALFVAAGRPTDRRRSEMFSLAGYSYTFFAENYCAGVPFSSLPISGGQPTFGTPTTTGRVDSLAVQRFDSALAIAPSGSLEQRLAQIGKGRALLNLGLRAAAAAAVAGVPTSFEYDVLYSSNTPKEENGVFSYTIDSGRYDVADEEGINGLPYVSDNDPRTPSSQDLQSPFDDNYPLFPVFNAQLKYPSRDADIPLATGTEARLIEAEALLAGGASNAYLVPLNQARAFVGLAPLADPGTANGRINQLFKERAYFLWLTSHRLGDLRRLMRQYGRPENQVFPTGPYIRGGSYGHDLNLPIFVDEENNPNFTGCISRGA